MANRCTRIFLPNGGSKPGTTVSRTLQLFESTGSVSKKVYPKDKAFRKLTTPAQLLILNLVIEKPGIYLREIQDELLQMLLEVDRVYFDHL